MAMKKTTMREEIHVQRNYNSWISYTQKKVLKIQQKNDDEQQQQPQQQTNKTHNQQFFFVKLNK